MKILLKKIKFKQKLLLIFLPLLLIPIMFVALLVFFSLLPAVEQNRRELLNIKIDLAYKQIQDIKYKIEMSGIEDSIFIKYTSENQIRNLVSEIDLPVGSFFIYNQKDEEFFILPKYGDTILTLNEELLLDYTFKSDNILLNVNDKNLEVLTTGYKPWDLILGIVYNPSDFYAPIYQLLFPVVIVWLSLIIISIILISRISVGISKPLVDLVDIVRSFGKGQYDSRANSMGMDEFSELGESFNKMADSIQESTVMLNQRVEEKTKALRLSLENEKKNYSILKETQEQLVESEKLAGLGSIVSGVAHEINTPLGIAFTSSSFIEERLIQIQHSIDSASLTKNHLTTFLEETTNANSMISQNLSRVNTIIKSFKNVSVDQMMESPRDFNLMFYIKETMESLRSVYKHVIENIPIQGDSEIELMTYPGAIWQIISNLLTNAIRYAFPDDFAKEPQIGIGFKSLGNNLELTFQDNGVGISEEIINNIFEPFVTTGRDIGGTGLGLNIVQNIIHNMGGKIEVESSEEGTCFSINLPNVVIS